MQASVDDKRIRILLIAVTLMTVSLLLMSAWLAWFYSMQPLLGLHQFRQTQTALTSYWACRGGMGAAYWTPVAGAPWSIPFEFPIYQWIVSGISCSSGSDMDATGRIVSYAFWIACLLPCWNICCKLLPRNASLYFLVFCSLFLSAQIYLFWGRTFLMETTALFFTLCYVAFALNLILGKGLWRHALGSAIFFSLAILQKSTTALPLLILALGYLYVSLPELLRHKIRAPALWKGALAFILPFSIGVLWVKYTDFIKSFNAFGTQLTSQQLSAWNFGTADARVSAHLWVDVIWHRIIVGNIGGYAGMLAILLALLLAPSSRRWMILILLVLFLSFFMIFENLMVVHDYYPTSNTIYLIFAVAVALAALMEKSSKYALLALSGLISIVAINLFSFFAGPLYAQEVASYGKADPFLASALFVREKTDPQGAILVYGDDWSSALPYYARRKSFAVSGNFQAYLDPIVHPEQYIASVPVAIMVCGDARVNAKIRTSVSTVYPGWVKNPLELCDIYTPN